MEEANARLWDDITDEELDGMTVEETEWAIHDDKLADWAVQKIKAEQDENKRLHDLADEQVAAIEAKIEAADRRLESRTSYLKSKLADYFITVPHKSTKTQEQYQLLSGKLVFNKPKDKLEKTDEELVKWLKESGNVKYIKITETPVWGEFKKLLSIAGDEVVIADTGEVVKGVKITPVDGTFEVK